MPRNIIYIVGTGTIGTPMIGILADQCESPEIGKVCTYQPLDTASLFNSISLNLDMFSLTKKVINQYLHIIHYDVRRNLKRMDG